MLPIYMHGVVQDYLLNQTATIFRSSAHTKASQLRLLTVLLPSEKDLAGGSWDLIVVSSLASQTVVCNSVLIAHGLVVLREWLEDIGREGTRGKVPFLLGVDLPGSLL